MGFSGLEAIVSEPVLLLGLMAFALLLGALPWSFWALSNGRSSSGVRSLIALSVADGSACAALVAIRTFSDQQPLRVAVFSRMGLHTHPAAGRTQLVLATCGSCSHTDGTWLHRLCEFRSS